MAFTATQVAKVMFHLNYPAASWSKSTIESALAAITALSTEIETEVTALITELDTLQADIAAFVASEAGVQVQTTGEVYFPTLGLAEKKSRYRQQLASLATITGLTNYAASQTRISFG